MKELYSKGKIPGHEDTGEIVPSYSQPSEASEYDSTYTSDENKVVQNIERRYLPDSSRPIYTVLGQTIAFVFIAHVLLTIYIIIQVIVVV